MDLILLISGLTQIALSFIIGVLFIYGAFKIFQKATKDIDDISELKNNNVAYSIMNGSVIFSVILIVKNSLEPAVTVLSNALRNPDTTFLTYAETAGIMLGHIVLSGALAFLCVYFALRFFMRLTRDLEEFEEIKKNNIAVGILVAVVIISMAIILQSGIQTLLDSLIPFPSIGIMDFGG